MPLTDLDEPYHPGDEVRFTMGDGVRRIWVRISREALQDAQARSGVVSFERHRPAFAALATKKYAKGDREPDGSVVLRSRDL